LSGARRLHDRRRAQVGFFLTSFGFKCEGEGKKKGREKGRREKGRKKNSSIHNILNGQTLVNGPALRRRAPPLSILKSLHPLGEMLSGFRTSTILFVLHFA